MNVNSKIVDAAKKVNLIAYPDEAPDSDEYVVFTYEDERPMQSGDDRPKADRAYIMLNLYTKPARKDYMKLKDKLRDELESEGFSVTSISSWVEDKLVGTGKIKHTVYQLEYTKWR